MIEIHEPILGRLFRDQAGSLSDERCVEFLYHSVLIPSICRFEFSNPKLVVVRPSFSLPDAISGSLHTFMQTCLDWMRHRSMEPLGICGANYILTNLFRLRMQKVLSTINESSRSIAGQTRSNESYTWDMPSDYHVPSVNGFLLAELLHTVKSVYPSQVNHSHNALPVNATISMASGFTEDDLNQLYFSGDWESLGRRGVPIIIGGGVPRW